MKHLMTFESYLFGREQFVEVINPVTGDSRVVKAKVDTETYTSNIDMRLAAELNLNTEVETKRVYNYLGDENLKVANVCLSTDVGEDNAKKLDTEVTIADRSKLRHPLAIGRKDLESFDAIIDVKKSL